MGKTTCPDSEEFARKLGSIKDLRQCPYNESHYVKSIKFQKHIVSCRKNFPEKAKTMQICAYNQTHHIPEGKEVMDEHLKDCYDYHAWLLYHYKKSKST